MIPFQVQTRNPHRIRDGLHCFGINAACAADAAQHAQDSRPATLEVIAVLPIATVTVIHGGARMNAPLKTLGVCIFEGACLLAFFVVAAFALLVATP